MSPADRGQRRVDARRRTAAPAETESPRADGQKADRKQTDPGTDRTQRTGRTATARAGREATTREATTREAAPRDPAPRDTDPRDTDEEAGETGRRTGSTRTGRTARRQAADPAAPRAVGASGTGRSVARAQSEARTTRVPARARTTATTDGQPARAAGRTAADPDTDGSGPRRRTRASVDGRTQDGAASDRENAGQVVRERPAQRTSRTTAPRTTTTRTTTSSESRSATARTGTTRERVRRDTDAPDDVEQQSNGTGRRSDDTGQRLRADRIDETLTRLTAAHAGLSLDEFGRSDDEPDELEDDDLDDLDAELDGPAPHPLVRPAMHVGRAAAAGIALLLVLVSGMGWVGRVRLDDALHEVPAVDVAPDGVLDAATQAGDRNVLLLTTDSGGSARATTRANTVVVVHTDAKGGRSVAVTLPPDLEITRPPCEHWDATAAAYSGQIVPAEPRTTLSSAYAVGGPRCATRAAQQVTGLAITRFVAVDLAATSALVEAVGGVDVCVEHPVLDAVLGPVLPAAGTGSLNGARAGDLVRAADVRDDPAPSAGLVHRQQRVLAGVLARALSLPRLLHPGRVSRVLPALGSVVVSSGTGVDDVLALSQTLARSDTTVADAPVEPAANSRGNQVLRDTDATALFTAVRTDTALPAADPAAAPTAATPADVSADVLNATGRDGLAAQVAGTLGDLGFHTAQVTNATRPALDTVVRFSPDRAEQAQLLSAAVPSASAVPDPGTSGVLQLVLGRSFDGTVRAAAPVPDAATAPAPATPAATCS